MFILLLFAAYDNTMERDIVTYTRTSRVHVFVPLTVVKCIFFYTFSLLLFFCVLYYHPLVITVVYVLLLFKCTVVEKFKNTKQFSFRSFFSFKFVLLAIEKKKKSVFDYFMFFFVLLLA